MGTKTLAPAAAASTIGVVGVRETGGVLKTRALNPRKLTSGRFFGWVWVVPWLLVMSGGVVGVKGVPIPDCTYAAYDSNTCSQSSCYNVRTCGIRQAVDDYITCTSNSGTNCGGSYGPIEDWDTSSVTDMSHVFEGNWNPSTTFNADISAWQVGKVTTMFASTYTLSPLSKIGHIPFSFLRQH